MATDPFVNTQESDLRKKWALMQLQMAGEATPVRHPMQAVARALQGAMGGYMAGEAKREDDATSASAIDTILGPVTKPSADQAPAPVAPGPIPPGPSSPRVPMVQNEITSPQSAPVKDIYSANEQSPLDPVDGAITPDRARLLAAIQAGESGGRPNVMYGGKTFDSYADHPRVANPIMSGPNAGMVSSAAGLNQMIAPTWDRAKNALNLQDFSPGNQNAAGAYIAGEDYKKRTGQSLDLALSQAGNDPARIAAIGRALSPTWTSLPGGIEPNQQTNQFVQNMQRPAPGGESPGIDMASAQSRVPGQQPSLVQGQPPSGNATSRSPVKVPPEMADTIRKLGANPATRAKAWELLMKYANPSEQWVQERNADGSIYQRNLTTGKLEAVEKSDVLPDAAVRQKVEIAAAGKPVTTIDQRAPDKFEAVYGEEAGKRASSIPNDANAAAQDLQSSAMSRAFLQKVNTGKLAETQATVGAWAKAIGIDPSKLGIDPNLPAVSQAAQSAIAQQTVSMIGSGGFPANNFSDADRKFLQSIPANIGNVPEANTLLADVRDRIAQRKIDKANAWSDFLDNRPAGETREAAFGRFEREWRNKIGKEDMFADVRSKVEGMQGGAITPKPGLVQQGYRFKGGNPADQNSWEKIQ